MSIFTFHEFLLLPYDTTAPKNINLLGMSLGIMLCCSSVSRIWYGWNCCIFTLLRILMFSLVLFFDRPVVCGGVLHFLVALVTGPDGCSTWVAGCCGVVWLIAGCCGVVWVAGCSSIIAWVIAGCSGIIAWVIGGCFGKNGWVIAGCCGIIAWEIAGCCVSIHCCRIICCGMACSWNALLYNCRNWLLLNFLWLYHWQLPHILEKKLVDLADQRSTRYCTFAACRCNASSWGLINAMTSEAKVKNGWLLAKALRDWGCRALLGDLCPTDGWDCCCFGSHLGHTTKSSLKSPSSSTKYHPQSMWIHPSQPGQCFLSWCSGRDNQLQGNIGQKERMSWCHHAGRKKFWQGTKK